MRWIEFVNYSIYNVDSENRFCLFRRIEKTGENNYNISYINTFLN